eukprot:TRINITY_DN2378_c0_g1_i1.p1 TRINITY_DN2378_c0_g1~~TRINITY_DN2378_c0_g1_i1.p1  ORF type:complete len:749 (+),score=99.51 TRINITY_DN2378_c0_g1_i1:110-2356(+)
MDSDLVEQHRAWLQVQRFTPSFAQYGQQQPTMFDENPKFKDFPDTFSPMEDQENVDPQDGVRKGSQNRRIKDIVEGLYAQGRIYDAHKEELRAKKLQQELAERATKHAARPPLLSGTGSYIERFELMEKDKQERLHKQRQEALQNDEEAKFRPKVSRRARSLGPRDTYAANEEWAATKQKRLEQAREKLKQEEIAEVKSMPNVNERSQRIMFRKLMKQRRENPDAPVPEFGDYQIERNRLAKVQLANKVLAEEAERNPGTPKITPFAASLRREGDVGTRMYEAWLERTERSDKPSEPSDSNSSYASAVEKAPTFSPVITQNASNIQRQLPVHVELLARHEYARMRREEKMREMQECEREAHQPVINPVSEEIAAKLGPSSDRLYRQPTRSLSDEYYTFQPDINPRSRDMADGVASRSEHTSLASGDGRASSSRIEHMYMQEQRRREKLEHMRVENEQRVLSECTFQPNTGRRINDRRDSAGSQALASRAAQWARRRDQKLTEERLKKERQDMEECTFNPDTRCVNRETPSSEEGPLYEVPAPPTVRHHAHVAPPSARYPTPPASSRETNSPPAEPWGFEDFVSRMQEAREKREELQPPFATGKGWSNKLTKPKPFNIGQPCPKAIAALRRPISPPVSPRISLRADDGVIRETITSLRPEGLPQQGLFSARTSQKILGATTPTAAEGERVGTPSRAPAVPANPVWSRATADEFEITPSNTLLELAAQYGMPEAPLPQPPRKQQGWVVDW